MVTDQDWMQQALQLAKEAALNDEVPVGAIVVKDNKIIGQSGNVSISMNDPTAHAEIVAVRAASRAINNYRLSGATVYVTLEPCMMCAGAMVHARIKRLVYGANDPKTGVVNTCDQLLAKPYLNHKVEVVGGVLADASTAILQAFFKARRRH